MQTSIPPTQILFIDGLPGSGKSVAAEAVGRHLRHSRVFLESAPDHPLLAATPDRMGAAFADIHEIHSWGSFAAAALGKLESFLDTAGCDVLYVFESHPIQSTVRVLFQLDAPQTSILKFWSDLQDRLAFRAASVDLFPGEHSSASYEGHCSKARTSLGKLFD